jgi:hypothetical protein
MLAAANTELADRLAEFRRTQERRILNLRLPELS